MNEQQRPEPQATSGRSSLGLDENVAGALAYFLGIVTGLIFFLVEKESRFVKFHAMQSILVWLVIVGVSIVIGLIPIIGWLFDFLLIFASFFLWLFLMYKAYKGEWFKLPVIGDIAEQQASNL